MLQVNKLECIEWQVLIHGICMLNLSKDNFLVQHNECNLSHTVTMISTNWSTIHQGDRLITDRNTLKCWISENLLVTVA